jgi:TolB protein
MLIEAAVRGAISPDGRTLAVLRDEAETTALLTLWLSSPPGAEPRRFEGPPFNQGAGSDGRLQYAPDGSRLLLWLTRSFDAARGETNNGFWQMRLPDGKPTPVLPSLSGARMPADFSWLPDSRHIVFTRDDGRTPGTHLWMADVDTDFSQRLTSTSGAEGAPSVSSDGARLAFTSEATDFDLITVPIDGSPVQPLLSSTRNEFDPAWSPVSAQMAFVSDRAGRQEIWLRNQDGEQRPLVTDAAFREPTTVYGSLAFSPDGQRLAYQRMSPETGWRIWISTLAGGSPVRLTVGGPELYQDSPSWSPDGNSIAFVTGVQTGGEGEWSLARTVAGSGAAPVVLSTGVIRFTRVAWSPDGRWIACQTEEGLLLVSPDGKSRRVLTDSNFLAYEWSSDARELFGLRTTDDLHGFMLVAVDVESGRERVVHANLGGIPHAHQPIRGFSRIGKTGFASSIARVRSDIWLLEGLQAPRSWRARFWPFNLIGLAAWRAR